ncbi:DUF6702 family protein [Kordiimonas aestuarii]|uniref:DUF6702 family protein n=1 Tax=Kordiimonas aestuarii TaxID=1005925 RepID=UPI0021D1D23D|nr:DUF6702 family protein [Kordiimonas aestuarii]
MIKLPMKSRFLAIFIVCTGLSLSALAHNVFATFTTIEWNPDDKSVELVMQMHAHELESHLSLNLGERLTFLDDEDYRKLEASVAPVIARMVALEVDGQLLDIHYLGMELQGQTVFLYMESAWPTAPKTIKFMNALFIDELPGQNNSVMATVNGVRRAGETLAGTGPVVMEF